MRWFQDLYRRPEMINPEQLLNVAAAEAFPQRYVTFSVVQATTAGKFYSSPSSKKVVARLLALPVKDRILLIKAPTKFQGNTIVGWVENPPPELLDAYMAESLRNIKELMQKPFNPFKPQKFEQRPQRLAVIVDATVSRTWDFIIAFAAAGLVLAGAGLAVRNFICARLRSIRPSRHPIVKVLEQYGSAESVAVEIDQELQSAQVETIAGHIVTPSWLLNPRAFGLEILKLDDVVWLYQQVIVRRKYGIPIRKEHSLLILTCQEKKLELLASPQNLQRLAERISQDRPRIPVGYDEQRQALWDRDPAEFVAQVKNRMM